MAAIGATVILLLAGIIFLAKLVWDILERKGIITKVDNDNEGSDSLSR